MTFVILIACLLGGIIWYFRGTGFYKGPISDHFDGKFFRNQNHTSPPSLWSVIKWRLIEDREPWPKEVITAKHIPLPSPKTGEVIVTYVNHASCLIQTEHVNILTDPHYSLRASPVSWAGPKRVHEPGVAYEDLPPIHVVLISHDHYDHMDQETLLMLERDHKPLYMTGLGCDAHMAAFGIKERIIVLDWWHHQQIDGIDFIYVPAQHFSGRGLLDMERTLWGGFVISVHNQKIFFAGDTGYGPHFKEIREKLGPMDISLIPIGAYLPRWFMAPRHMNPEDAVKAHIDLESRKSIGIHFKTFHLTDEPYEQPVHDLESAMVKHAIAKEAFVAPEFGESYLLEKPAKTSRTSVKGKT